MSVADSAISCSDYHTYHQVHHLIRLFRDLVIKLQLQRLALKAPQPPLVSTLVPLAKSQSLLQLLPVLTARLIALWVARHTLASQCCLLQIAMVEHRQPPRVRPPHLPL